MEYERPLYDEPGGMLISPENWEKLRARSFKIDQWFEKAVNDAITKW